MNNTQSFSLIEISKWAEKRQVTLPTVQRGFVWKPNQIENLWDSLLRGYPVGAFVLSQKERLNSKKEATYDLLDGQQRATAICLGFGMDTFRDSQAKVKVFIDLEKPTNIDNRKYIFRVITKSHPWGYQRNDSSKTLDSENIRNAMNLYCIDDHLSADLKDFFPYDATLPVPFEFFLTTVITESEDDCLKEKVEKWALWERIKENWVSKVDKDKKDHLGIRTEKEIYSRLFSILNDVRKMLSSEVGQRIPALYLDFASVTANPIFVEENDEDQGNDNETDEVENLFIRLNSGGTPLRGEELNYSVLKSKINNTLQIKIEDACKELFNPARFIAIVYRLFKSNDGVSSASSALTLRIKPKQFQAVINSEIDNFTIFLLAILERKDFDGRTLLEYVKLLLEYSKNNEIGLPYLVVSRISDAAPEVMLMLLFRLKIKRDRFTLESDMHKRLIGLISLFLWFGKGDKQKDHSKLLSNIWPCVKTLTIDRFWSSSTVQRAMIDEALIFPSNKQLVDFCKRVDNLTITPKKNIRKNLFVADPILGKFFDKSFQNRDMILYAQRQALSEWFKQIHFNLEDTNIPFDWDHISPNSLIKHKRNRPTQIMEWYSTNGNFRAWPYSLNRIDQDSYPAKKLNPLGSGNFSDQDKYKITENLWKAYFNKSDKFFAKKLSPKNLSKKLCQWSFVVDDWTACRVSDIKNNHPDVRKLTKLIIDRNVLIFFEWHDKLMIKNLMPKAAKTNFPQLTNNTIWRKNPSEYGETFIDDGDSTYRVLSNQDSSNGSFDLNLYIGYPSGQNEADILREENITFGIFGRNENNFILKNPIPKKFENEYIYYSDEDYFYVYREFTLISHDEESYVRLFSEFRIWLEKFPHKAVKAFSATFIDSLKSSYKDQV